MNLKRGEDGVRDGVMRIGTSCRFCCFVGPLSKWMKNVVDA